jgi:hypothetical protein
MRDKCASSLTSLLFIPRIATAIRMMTALSVFRVVIKPERNTWHTIIAAGAAMRRYGIE